MSIRELRLPEMYYEYSHVKSGEQTNETPYKDK